MRYSSALVTVLALSACQAQPPSDENAARVLAGTGTVEERFPVQACRQLGTFAIAITNGRKDGITRNQALAQAQAGPLTGVFQAIVEDVYAAPQPRSEADWRALQNAAAVKTTQSCIETSTGRRVEVRTRG